MTMRAHIYGCVYGAYTAAVAIAFGGGAIDILAAAMDDFSSANITALLLLPFNIFVAALVAIPMAGLGLVAGVPGIAGGYVVAQKLRARAIKGLWSWLGAGACVGGANAVLVLLLVPARGAGEVLGGLATGGALAAFYLWRAERERPYYNT